jgi:muramoyltetrapeptide carboxypeptidase
VPQPRSVYVFPPSYALQNPLEHEKIARQARAVCETLGWTLVFSPLLDRFPGPGAWLGTAERAADLKTALEHDYIWACRGGFGCIHLVPELLQTEVERKNILIGFSDITLLHACWNVQGRGRGIYGTIPEKLQGSRAGESLLELLRGEPWRRDAESDASVRVLRPGRTTGVSFAACLTVLSALNGTPAAPQLNGAMLFIEDVDERPYKVDFALNTLHLAGRLEGVRALIGGSFKHQNPGDYWGPSMEEVLAAWGERLQIPVLARMPFGHWDDALCVPIGTRMELSAESHTQWRLNACEPLIAG